MPFQDFRPTDVTFTPDTNAYSSGDVVGGLLTVTLNPFPCILTGVVVSIGEASKALAGTLYLYSAVPTTFADNAAFAPVHADNAKLIGEVLLPTALSLNSRNVYSSHLNQGTNFPLLQIWTNPIYIYYVTTSTPTFSAAQTVALRFLAMAG